MEMEIQHIKQLTVYHMNVSRDAESSDDSDTLNFSYMRTAQ